MSLIELHNLGKCFPANEKKWVFRHLDYSFPAKGLFLICGPSGCGKSTLLSILSGLSKPTEGVVSFHQRSLTKMDESRLGQYRSKDIGLVFQHYNLIEGLSSLQNVQLAYLISRSKNGKDRSEELLRNVGLEGKFHQYADTLSGGEKQRVAICRALINSPKVLFADEPTGALDKKNSIAIMDLLSSIAKKTLVIVVSHDLDLTLPYTDGVLDLGAIKGE